MKKVCRTCRLLVEGDHCPLCGKKEFTTTWSGIALVCDPQNSEIAQAMGIEVKGKFALRVR